MNTLEIAFRGAAKTSLLKMFVVYVLIFDGDQKKKYIKFLTRDGKNSRQFVTDVYNLIIETRDVFGNLFAKEDDKKRETTMLSFTMLDGRKLGSGTVGQSQRGHVQYAYRPDWVLGDDVEDRDSISSAVITQGIIDGIDEAFTGLSLDGGWCFCANYISDTGVVERLKTIADFTRITPLLDVDGNVTWGAITQSKVEEYRKSLDFYGEYMCDPSRSENKFFDIERIEEDIKNAKKPSRESAGVRYWDTYKPHHRYGLGSDHSEGVLLDSNTLALFDFNTGELVATQASNEISPDLHAHECMRVGGEFGNCLWAPETNNKCGGVVITTGRDYPNLYREHQEMRAGKKVTSRLGWYTTHLTKTAAFIDFRRDYDDGLVKIYDVDVLKEMKAFTNNDLTDTTTGLITRHFDLLMAVVIAWQMNKYAGVSDDKIQSFYEQLDNKPEPETIGVGD